MQRIPLRVLVDIGIAATLLLSVYTLCTLWHTLINSQVLAHKAALHSPRSRIFLVSHSLGASWGRCRLHGGRLRDSNICRRKCKRSSSGLGIDAKAPLMVVDLARPEDALRVLRLMQEVRPHLQHNNTVSDIQHCAL